MIDVHVQVIGVGRSGPQKGFFNKMDFVFDVDDEAQYAVFQQAMADAGQQLGALGGVTSSPHHDPNKKK